MPDINNLQILNRRILKSLWTDIYIFEFFIIKLSTKSDFWLGHYNISQAQRYWLLVTTLYNAFSFYDGLFKLNKIELNGK